MISSEKNLPEASPQTYHEHFNINVQKNYHHLAPVLNSQLTKSSRSDHQSSLSSLRQGTGGTQANKTSGPTKMGTTQMVSTILDSSKKRKKTKLIWAAQVGTANCSVAHHEQSMESSQSYFVGGGAPSNPHRQARNSSRRLPLLQQQGEIPKLKKEEITNAYLTSSVKRTPKHQFGLTDSYLTPNRVLSNTQKKSSRGDLYLKKAKALELELLRGLNGLSTASRRDKSSGKASESKKERVERKKVSAFASTRGDKPRVHGDSGFASIDLGRNVDLTKTSTSTTSRNQPHRSIHKMKTHETASTTSTDSRFRQGQLPVISSMNSTRGIEVSDVSSFGLGHASYMHQPQSTRARGGKKPMFTGPFELKKIGSERELGAGYAPDAVQRSEASLQQESLSSRLIFNLAQKPKLVTKLTAKGEAKGSLTASRKRTGNSKTGGKRLISESSKKYNSPVSHGYHITVGGLTSGSNATMQTLSQTPLSSDISQGFENACKKVNFQPPTSEASSTSTLMYDPPTKLKIKLVRCKVV